LGDISNLYAAVKFYTARRRQKVKNFVPDLVAELLQKAILQKSKLGLYSINQEVI
jgi:hypothetical protein